MEYTKLKNGQVPKRERNIESRVTKLPIWPKVKKDLDKGIEAGGARMIALTEEDKQTYKISNRRTVVRFIQKYVEDLGLQYEVKGVSHLGLDCVIIANEAAQ